MNRNLKFAIGQFVLFLAGAGLCKLVAMPFLMSILVLAALVATYGIYEALPSTGKKPDALPDRAVTEEIAAEIAAEEDGIAFG